MKDAEATRRFFDAIAPRYDRVYARARDEMRPRMARLLRLLDAPRDVLDLGVGTGPELHHLLDAGHRVVGVDVSEKMIALCNRRARPIPCILADFWSGLPAPDASFDAVIALFGTLAHPPEPSAFERLAREVHRVLRPGGVFYAEAPTLAWAAANPRFEDEASGVRIEVVAQDVAAWRRAFGGFVDSTLRRPAYGGFVDSTLRRPAYGGFVDSTLRRPAYGGFVDSTLRRPAYGGFVDVSATEMGDEIEIVARRR